MKKFTALLALATFTAFAVPGWAAEDPPSWYSAFLLRCRENAQGCAPGQECTLIMNDPNNDLIRCECVGAIS